MHSYIIHMYSVAQPKLLDTHKKYFFIIKQYTL